MAQHRPAGRQPAVSPYQQQARASKRLWVPQQALLSRPSASELRRAQSQACRGACRRASGRVCQGMRGLCLADLRPSWFNALRRATSCNAQTPAALSSYSPVYVHHLSLLQSPVSFSKPGAVTALYQQHFHLSIYLIDRRPVDRHSRFYYFRSFFPPSGHYYRPVLKSTSTDHIILTGITMAGDTPGPKFVEIHRTKMYSARGLTLVTEWPIFRCCQTMISNPAGLPQRSQANHPF